MIKMIMTNHHNRSNHENAKVVHFLVISAKLPNFFFFWHICKILLVTPCPPRAQPPPPPPPWTTLRQEGKNMYTHTCYIRVLSRQRIELCRKKVIMTTQIFLLLFFSCSFPDILFFFFFYLPRCYSLYGRCLCIHRCSVLALYSFVIFSLVRFPSDKIQIAGLIFSWSSLVLFIHIPSDSLNIS